MRKQDELKQKYSTPVSQTIGAPITVFDFWELQDVFIGLGIILVFGVLFYSWISMFTLLFLFLGLGPVVKRKYPKGIFFHWPYAYLGMDLPGMINPKSKKQTFSD